MYNRGQREHCLCEMVGDGWIVALFDKSFVNSLLRRNIVELGIFKKVGELEYKP